MTKHISDTLGLPMLEDALRESGALPVAEIEDEAPVEAAPDPKHAARIADAARRMAEAGGEDHARAMDLVHRETLDNARQLFDLAMNMDHARARGMFEQSANFFKLAVDAKDAKRKRQLDAMTLMIQQQKMELEQQRLKGDGGSLDGSTSDAVIVEDRNELIRRMRDKLNGAK